jgi:hypothetical protein
MKTSNQLIACAAAAMAGLLTLSGVGAAPIETNPVPGFNSTSGNPTTDAHGNQWTACQVAYTGVNDGGAWGASLHTTAGWVPMTLNGSYYRGVNYNYQSAPSANGTAFFVERNWDTGINYNGGFIFKPDVAGTYSWDGKLGWNNWGGGNNALDLVFGKFTAAGVWSTLLTTTLSSEPITSYKLIMTDHPELLNIVLQAGDTLVVAGKISVQSQNGNFNFGDTSINLVPEPASLALLALGGLALFRRRR